MAKSSISIDLDDPRTGLVAEALSNKTCVKILGILAEEELTATDIANRLGIPLNTTGYNIEKLITCGLIEKSSNFFWSVKGKKTSVYRVANKKIVITPKRVIKGVIPAVILSGIGAVVIRYFIVSVQKTGIAETMANSALSTDVNVATRAAPEAAITIAQNAGGLSGAWSWFFIGALFSLIVLFLWDYVAYLRKTQ